MKALSIQTCNFFTLNTAVHVFATNKEISTIKLRVFQSYFELNTSDPAFIVDRKVLWMLWNTSFQINNYSIMSSDQNFTNQIERLIKRNDEEESIDSISETHYASGKSLLIQELIC